MTTFQEHDRLRVVDASHRHFGPAVRGGGRRQLATGEIVEVMRVHGNSVQLVGFPAIWRGNRFELVERAVNTDRDGKPLYVGDIVRRLDTADGVPGEGPVSPQRWGPHSASKVAFTARNETGTALLTPERDQVILVRHHWEPPEPVVQFQADDRVRVRDTAENRRTAALNVGDVLTVDRPDRALMGNDILFFEGHPTSWAAHRFELVEHSTGCSDREGRTLYAGDVVRRNADDGFLGAPYRATVSATQSNRAAGIELQLDHTNGRSTVWAPAQFVELVRHHWEPEAPAKKGAFGPEVAGHELRVGAFMVLQRKSALAWGKVDGWSVRTGAHVEVSLKDDGPAQTYRLDEWEVVLHQPAVSPDSSIRVAWDGSTSDPNIAGYEVRLDDQPVRFLPVSNHGGGRAVDIKLDPAEVAEFARVIQDYARQISRALGLPEPPAPPVWDDVEVGMSVRVRVKATNEVFVAMVTESPSHREGQPTSPHIHGLWIGIGAIKKGWELLSLSPELPTTEGSIIAPDSNPANRSRAYLIDGEWWFDPKGPKAILPMKADLDNFRDWRVIRDAGKDF